jgi:hypothetical protein
MSGIAMLLSYLLPCLIVFTNTPMVQVGYIAFVAHFLPSMSMCLVIVYWVQKQGWARPHDASVLSWQVLLFQFARWPWILAGCLDATISTFGGKKRNFTVTPKVAEKSSAYEGAGTVLHRGVESVAAMYWGGAGEKVIGYYYVNIQYF